MEQSTTILNYARRWIKREVDQDPELETGLEQLGL